MVLRIVLVLMVLVIVIVVLLTLMVRRVLMILIVLLIIVDCTVPKILICLINSSLSCSEKRSPLLSLTIKD